MSVNFERMALDLWFRPITGPKFNPSDYGATYRKDKRGADVVNAMTKASKNGNGKTETELLMLEAYLRLVFKAER